MPRPQACKRDDGGLIDVPHVLIDESCCVYTKDVCCATCPHALRPDPDVRPCAPPVCFKVDTAYHIANPSPKNCTKVGGAGKDPLLISHTPLGLTLSGPLLHEPDLLNNCPGQDPILDIDCTVPTYNPNVVIHTKVLGTLASFHDTLPPADMGVGPYQYARVKHAIWPELVGHLWSASPVYAYLYSEVSATGLPNHLGARLPVPSGLRIPRWRHHLADYHDNIVCDYLEFGWPIGYTALVPPTSVGVNHKSAVDYPCEIQNYIDTELALGGIIGPFTASPFQPWTHVAPLLTQPKRGSSHRRVILDLSYPEGTTTVNAGITKNCLDGRSHAYTLPTVEDLATHVRLLGPSSWLWSSDLSRAYKQLRACPGDIPLLGFMFNGHTYLDVCPSFGARLSAGACQRTTSAVCYLMRKMGYNVLVYLDDFCGIECSRQKADEAYAAFMALTADLGLQLAPTKCIPPTNCLEWLGFIVDTNAMIVSVPGPKLLEILQECRQWTARNAASKKDIQSLVGKLVHISRCLPHARRFICRILSTLRNAPERGQVHLTTSFKADVRWFEKYAELSNGTRLLEPDLVDFNIECDSSLTGGGGNSDVCFYELPYDKSHYKICTHITQSEAVNIVTAYRTLTPHYAVGMRVVVYTDSLSSKFALQTGKTKDSVLAACSRQMWLEAALRDQTVSIRHKPGVQIPLADALSRSKDPAMKRKAARMVNERGLKRLHPKKPMPFFSRI